MCHPKGQEVKYRIAAKVTPRKTVSKAHHTLDVALAIASMIKSVSANETSEGVKSMVQDVTDKELKEVKKTNLYC